MPRPERSGSRALFRVAPIFALFVTRGASAQHMPLPATLVALESPDGQRLFEEADALGAAVQTRRLKRQITT
jgi:hypothetical protein